MLPNVGSWEMIIIILVIFLVFGAKRLPEVARGLGRGLREFKREMQGLTDDIGRTPDAESRRSPEPDRSADTRSVSPAAEEEKPQQSANPVSGADATPAPEPAKPQDGEKGA